MSKTTGVVLGIILSIVGVALAIFGFISFLGAPGDMSNPQGAFMSAGLGMGAGFVGIVLIIIGIITLYLTHIGKIFSYMAKETAPGIEKTTHAVGKGLASGVKKGWKEK